MKKTAILLCATFVVAACDVFNVQPQPFPVWSPIPTRTPGIVTATPIILTLPLTETPTSGATATATVAIAISETPTVTLTPTPTETATPTPVQSIQADIIGCNTGIDIMHGMGEVTNAYVALKNTGAVDLPNTCALLRAIDEDREHPDKKGCVPNLPAQNQVTLKLTVDSAYRQNTAIQVDVSSNDVLLLRVDKLSCADIGLFGGAPADLGIIKPIE